MAKEKIFVTIRKGKNSETLESWRYYSIINVLGWYDVARPEAYDAAKWAQKAKPGDKREVWPEVTMEVTDGVHQTQ